MDRRGFVRVATYGAVAAPLIAIAQKRATIRRIGFLNPGAPDPVDDLQTSASLKKFGWVERQNLLVERRSANTNAELLGPLAEDLVRLRVELIVTAGTSATLAAMRATKTIPIVFWGAADPVRTGLVASLARPGGNVTGFSQVITELESKRLALLHELLPALKRIGRLENLSNPYYRDTRKEFEEACSALGVEPVHVEVSGARQLANAIAALSRQSDTGLLVSNDTLFFDNRVEVMRAALTHALPTTVSNEFIREAGALVSYDRLGSEEDERGAAIVDRILRGAKPSEVAVERPTKFEFIVNLKTAKALGITIPPTLLSRADEVVN